MIVEVALLRLSLLAGELDVERRFDAKWADNIYMTEQRDTKLLKLYLSRYRIHGMLYLRLLNVAKAANSTWRQRLGI